MFCRKGAPPPGENESRGVMSPRPKMPRNAALCPLRQQQGKQELPRGASLPSISRALPSDGINIPKSADCRNIRRTVPPVLRALAERRQSPAQSPDFCACSAQRPAFAAAANSPAAPNLRALLRRAIPAAPPNVPTHPPPRRLPCFCIPPFACNFSLFTKPPPASYCLSGFFSIYSLAGKIITFNLFVRLT